MTFVLWLIFFFFSYKQTFGKMPDNCQLGAKTKEKLSKNNSKIDKEKKILKQNETLKELFLFWRKCKYNVGEEKTKSFYNIG